MVETLVLIIIKINQKKIRSICSDGTGKINFAFKGIYSDSTDYNKIRNIYSDNKSEVFI